LIDWLKHLESQGWRGYGDSHGYGYGMGMGTVMNPHGPVRILWGFLNGCEIERKRIKYAINVVVDVWISLNRVKFWICFNGIFEFFLHYHCWIHIGLVTVKYASTKRLRVWGISMEDFGVLWVWGFPQVFLLVWDGYGDWNPIPTAPWKSPFIDGYLWTPQSSIVHLLKWWGNCKFRFWPPVGGCGPHIDGFGPLVKMVGEL